MWKYLGMGDKRTGAIIHSQGGFTYSTDRHPKPQTPTTLG